MKAYKGHRSKALHILDLETSWVGRFILRPIYSWENSLMLTTGEPQSQSGCSSKDKNHWPCRKSNSCHPVCRHSFYWLEH